MNEQEAVIVEANKQQEPVRGVRGEVGVATPSLTIKKMYHAACFKRVNISTLVKNPSNKNKQVFLANPNAPSLKRFVRELVASGDAAAKEWLANKAGAKNEKRTDVNIALSRACATATKAGRRAVKKD